MSLLLAGAAISAIGQIYSGVSSMNAANQTAKDLRVQGQITYNESLRTAAMIEEEGTKFAASQSLQYIGSGVELAGSALVTIAQTMKYARTEAEAVRSQGRAQRDLYYTKAQRTENEGRASLVSGIIGGASKFLGAVNTSGGAAEPAAKTTSEKTTGSSGFYSAFDAARERGSVD